MKIKVSDKHLGECNVTVNNDIDKAREYAIKSLCMLQLLCMNNETDKTTFNEFLDIMKEAVVKSEELFNGVKNEPTILNQF